ncbi:DUF5677 domain-containing protein [Vibrio lentus]|nr:DUF5677 domain-containing protein [Vibrio lentus]PMH97678.1 hypothetical protein BCU54_07090 [Vibrio lentus]
MITNELLKKFRDRHPELDVSKMDLSDINEGYEFFNDNQKAVRLDTEPHFKCEVALIQTQLLSLNSLTAYCLNYEDSTNRVISVEFPFKDVHLASILTNISNTAQCIYELCLNGFTVQADILYRTLLERTMQSIVLLNNGDDMERWFSAQDSDSSKATHYELFAKRERLHKRYEAIERDLLQVNPNSQELRSFRKSKMENASLAVHGSSSSVTLGSFAYWNEDEVKPAMFGSSCKTSLHVLDNVVFELWFFFVLLTRTLSKTHSWERDYEDSRVLNFELYRYIAHKQFEEKHRTLLET